MSAVVLGDNTWVTGPSGPVFLAAGTRRDALDPEVAPLVGEHLWVGESARPNVSPSGEALSGLRDNVFVDGVMYEKGSIPPAEVARKIGDHMWVDGPPDAVEADSSPAPEVPVTEVPNDADVVTDAEPVTEPSGTETGAEPKSEAVTVPVPPKGGPGSGKGAWAEYARAHRVDIEAGASREDIIDALDDAGVPTE